MRVFLSILLVLFSLTPVMAADEAAIGYAQDVQGSVIAHRGDESVTLADEAPIYQHDVIKTDEGDFARLVFIDETSIEITGMDGSLTIDEYVYEPNHPEKNSAEFSVLKGSFKYVSGLLHQDDDDTRINLDFGSIGIRGTTIYRSMKKGECWIYLEDGKIDVFNDVGRVTLNPGDGTILSSRLKRPSSVRPWSEKEINWIKGSVDVSATEMDASEEEAH